MTAETFAELSASPPRRAFGASVLAALGALLLWIGATGGTDVLWRFGLLVVGGLALAGGYRIWHASKDRIELRSDGLFDSTGRVIAPLSEIVAVDRGTFAFKPSNGFVLRLNTPGPRAWAPGLWWRVGRRVGVGGVTSPGQARAMAEILTAMLAQRDAAGAVERP